MNPPQKYIIAVMIFESSKYQECAICVENRSLPQRVMLYGPRDFAESWFQFLGLYTKLGQPIYQEVPEPSEPHP